MTKLTKLLAVVLVSGIVSGCGITPILIDKEHQGVRQQGGFVVQATSDEKIPDQKINLVFKVEKDAEGALEWDEVTQDVKSLLVNQGVKLDPTGKEVSIVFNSVKYISGGPNRGSTAKQVMSAGLIGSIGQAIAVGAAGAVMEQAAAHSETKKEVAEDDPNKYSIVNYTILSDNFRSDVEVSNVMTYLSYKKIAKMMIEGTVPQFFNKNTP